MRHGTFQKKPQPGNADIGNGSHEKDPFKIYPIGCLDSLTEGVGQDPVLDTAHQLVSLLGQTQSQDLEAGLVHEC